jgi:hypothetical protein
MLRAAFKLALRQIEGLMTSVLSLMGLKISAPDHGQPSTDVRQLNMAAGQAGTAATRARYAAANAGVGER